MSAPAAYDIDIEADDVEVTDTVTVVWKMSQISDKIYGIMFVEEKNRYLASILPEGSL